MLMVSRLNCLFWVVMLVVRCWCRMFFLSIIYFSVMFGWFFLNILDRCCMWIMLLLLIVVMVRVLVFWVSRGRVR